MLDGEVQSHRNVQCLMWSGKGGFCHRFCLIYIWTICRLIFKECQTGCKAGGTIANHLMYADDIVLRSPSATGLSLLLHVCGKY